MMIQILASLQGQIGQGRRENGRAVEQITAFPPL